MAANPEFVATLRRTLISEILAAFGVSDGSRWRALLRLPAWWPAHIFARLAVDVDADIAAHGLQAAAGRLLPRFVEHLDTCGAERIPAGGPLLVACNHPGAYDSVALIAGLPRPDLHVVVSDVPFLHSLPALDSRCIYTVAGAYGRMSALRGALRHLQRGGAILIFPTGVVDPDPDVLPGAVDKLSDWSPSLEVLLRHVPDTRLVVAIASGVLAPAGLHSPLLRLQQEPWRQRKLSEFLQVIQQLVFHRNYHLRTRITFSAPVSYAELSEGAGGDTILPVIIARARQTLDFHLSWQVAPKCTNGAVRI